MNCSSSQAEHSNQNHRLHAVNTTPNSLISIGNGDKDEDVHHDSTSSINSLVNKRRNSIATAESNGSKRPRADSNDYPTNGTVSADESNRPESVQNVTAPIIDDLFVAVTTEPYQDLTLKQATNIRKSLERKLKDNLLCPATSAETSKVRFRNQAHFCDGVLKIQCENHEALAWIREAVTSVPAPIADTTLVVKSQADVQRILCKLFVPDDDFTEIASLIKLLGTQNTAVDVNSWTLIRGERCFENEMLGVRLYLRVPVKDVDTLESQQRRLYWLMGNIFIEINSSMTPEIRAIKEEEDEEEIV